MMSIKGVLFDFDGTIANTIPVCVLAFQDTFRAMNAHVPTDDEVVAMFGPSEEGIFQRAMPAHWEEALQIFLKAYRKHHDACPQPFAGIPQALQLLQQRGIPMALVTGKGPHSAAYSLDYLGITHYFDVIEVGKPEGVVKMRAIEEILQKWQLAPEDAIYVGDADYDMLEAQAAGVLPVGACWATTHTIKPENAQTSFTSTSAFLRWLEANTATQEGAKR
uniref:Phosphohydrolase n=1 Tax=Thermosporothrix sp. COM3 TaxID=2490863 RepID=A0A455SY33_9CHLR|nr:phosphohydrolase [Thermosporothrix sp. COM3]